MNKKLLTLLLTILLIGGWQTAGANAPQEVAPQMPYKLFGTVTVDGSAAAAGTEIVATVGTGADANTVTTTVFGSNGSYALDMPADDPDTSADEGGVNGDAVALTLATGAPFNESATFTSGATERLDLTADSIDCLATADDGANVFESADGSAVQLAVDAAASGETVKIAGLCVGGLGDDHALLSLDKNLTVLGGFDGVDWTTAAPAQNQTILDANAEGRVVVANSGVSAIDGLTLRGGATTGTDGAGVLVGNNANVTIRNSLIEANTTDANGGGVASTGILTIEGSTIRGNSADNGGGVSIERGVIRNSTIRGNSAESGGGIIVTCCEDGATVTLESVTVSDNSAPIGANVLNEFVLEMTNTLIADGTGGAECRNDGTFVSNGYNMVSDSSCLRVGGFLAPNDYDDDPQLTPLADNGGATPTHALPADSPAVGAGGNCPETDQRGEARGAVCDIGAYQSLLADLVAESLQASATATCLGQSVTLDFAIANAGTTGSGAFAYALYENGAEIHSASIPDLASGDSLTDTLTYTPSVTGTRTLALRVDYGEAVGEINEDNNNKQVLLNVQGSIRPHGSMTIDNDAEWTIDSRVDLQIVADSADTCTSAPTEMRVYYDDVYDAWQPFASEITDYDLPYTFPYVETVYVQLRDADGNVSDLLSDSIGFEFSDPTSQINEPSGTVYAEQFLVKWEGADYQSGIASYNIEVRVNDGDWTSWLPATTDTQATYSAAFGNNYCFRSTATDNVGRTQPRSFWNPDHGTSCVTVSDPDAGTDLYGTDMTFLQVIQTPSNSVPLIVGKPTLVRVGVGLAEGGEAIEGVTGNLHVYRGGVELAGSPLSAENAPITAQLNPLRNRDDALLHFRLPSEWLTGTLQFAVEIDPDNTIAEDLELNNRFPLVGFQEATFVETMPLEVTIVPINTTFIDSFNFGIAPYVMTVSDEQIAKTMERVEQTFPTNEVIITVHEPLFYDGPDVIPQVFGIAHPNGIDVLESVRAIQEAELPNPAPNQLYYGIIADATEVLPGFAPLSGGIAYKPGHTGIGVVAPWTTTHEMGHNLDLWHIGCPGGAEPFEDYEFADGRIGYQGWDSTNNTIVPATHKAMMSYCGPTWMSVHTYMTVFEQLVIRPDAPLPRETGRAVAQDILFVSGEVSADGTTGSLTSAFALLQFSEPTSQDEIGRFRVAVIDANGNEVQTVSFGEPLIGRAASLPETFTFNYSFPDVSNASAVRLYYDGFLLDEIVAGIVPTVNITSDPPTTGDYTLTWTGDGDEYFVRYSADNGATWSVLSPPLSDTELFIDADYLKGSTDALLQVFGSRDLQSSSAVLGPFTIVDKAPTVTISNPAADGQIFTAGTTVQLKGDALDVEDGTVSDVTWSSDVDGALGTGDLLELTTLSTGVHIITLSATDSAGNTTTATVQLEIVPAGISVVQPIDGTGVYGFGRTDVSIEVVNTGDCLDSISVVRFDVDHPDATAGLQTGHYWRIAQSGCDAGDEYVINLTLPTDHTPTSSDAICGWNGVEWDCKRFSSDAANKTVTRNNIRDLSPDWVVGIDAVPTQIGGLTQALSSGSGFWVMLIALVGLFEATRFVVKRR